MNTNYDKQLLVDFMAFLADRRIFPMQEIPDIDGEEQAHHVFDFHLIYDEYLEESD